MSENLNPNHEKAKKILKIAGTISLVAGLICAVIGFVDIIVTSSSDSFEQPKLFFFLFIGLPLMAFGGMMLLFGFHRELMRYTKNESVPVINEAGKEISPAVKDIASAVNSVSGEKAKCPFCNAENDKDAKFCSSCGKSLTEIVCPACGEKNPSDGKFCKNCGEKLK